MNTPVQEVEEMSSSDKDVIQETTETLPSKVTQPAKKQVKKKVQKKDTAQDRKQKILKEKTAFEETKEKISPSLEESVDDENNEKESSVEDEIDIDENNSEVEEVSSGKKETEQNAVTPENTEKNQDKKKRKKTAGLPNASIKRIMLVGGSGINLGKKKTKDGKTSNEDSKLRISKMAIQYVKDKAEGWIDELTLQSMLFMRVAKRKVLQTEDLEAAIETKYPSYDLAKLKNAKSKDNFELHKKKGPKTGGSKPVLYLPTAAIRDVIKKKALTIKVREGFKIGMQYFIEQKILECSRSAARLACEKNKKTVELKTIMFVVEEYKGY